MKVPNISEEIFLAALIDGLLAGAKFVLLTTDPLVPLPTTELGDLEQPTFSGYDADDGDMDLAGVNWGEPVLEEDGRYSTTGDGDLEFAHNGGEDDDTITGWAMLSGEGELLAVEALPEPFLMDGATKRIRITPYFSLQSRDEVEDPEPPEVESAEIPTEGNTLAIVFGQIVHGNTGFSLDASGGAVGLIYASGSGTNTLLYGLDRTVESGETVTLDYAGGNIVDATGNPLESISGQAVTNNSTAGGG